MTKKLSILLIIALTLMSIFGCSQTMNVQGDNITDEVGNEFKAQMTFNGSSTLAPVISSIATEFIENYTTWDKVDSSFPDKNISIYVSAGGSGAGVKSVLEATSDFGMLARNVKDSEKEKIENLNEFVLGIDALAISVNPENPLLQIKDGLSKDEIVKIFSGEYKYWSDLDPSLEKREIVKVIRDLGGGAHEVFQNSIMGDVKVSSDAIQSPSMGALVTKVMENKDAIGYASFGMVNQNEGKIIPLKVDGIEPTVKTIVDGSYKVSRPLIAIKNGELTAEQKAFMDYILSERGSEIIENMGFVPVN